MVRSKRSSAPSQLGGRRRQENGEKGRAKRRDHYPQVAGADATNAPRLTPTVNLQACRGLSQEVSRLMALVFPIYSCSALACLGMSLTLYIERWMGVLKARRECPLLLELEGEAGIADPLIDKEPSSLNGPALCTPCTFWQVAAARHCVLVAQLHLQKSFTCMASHALCCCILLFQVLAFKDWEEHAAGEP